MEISRDKNLKNLAISQFYRSFEVYETEYTESTLYNHLSIIHDHIVTYGSDGIWRGKAVHLQRLAIFKNWKNANHITGYNYKQLSEREHSLTVDKVYQNVLPDGSISNYNVTAFTRLLDTGGTLFITEFKILSSLIEYSYAFESSYLKNKAAAFAHYWLYKLENIWDDTISFNDLLASKYRLSNESITQPGSNQNVRQKLMDTYSLQHPTSFELKNIAVKSLSSGKLEINATIKQHSEFDKPMLMQHRWMVENDPSAPFFRVNTFDIVDIRPAFAQ